MHRFANPLRYQRIADAVLPWAGGLAVMLSVVGLYLALVVAPPDYQQGEAYRIMFVHVPAAWMALMVYAMMAVASVVALVWRHPLAEIAARAAAPIGAAFTAIALVTGSLWGKPMWGTFWVWDARLTSVLILLFLYLGYIAPRRLRRAGPRCPRRRDPVPGRLDQPADHQVLGRLVEHLQAVLDPACGRPGDPSEHALATRRDVARLLVLLRGGAYLAHPRGADRAQDPQPALVRRSGRVIVAACRRLGDHDGRFRTRQPRRPPRAQGRRPELRYFSLERAAAQLGDASRLPYSLKVLFENLLRHENGRSVTVEHLQALVQWLRARRSEQEIAYRPARVLMQDFTGVPAVVDLAAMRQAMLDLGGDPQRINPLSPVDLVIDHSVQVDAFGGPNAFQINVEREYERNGERYAFLRWGAAAFDNFRVVPPGTGICHQVNLEYLAQVVWTAADGNRQLAYPDTLVGTDSHTTMVNGLAVLGWGVGGIEAEAAMLGQPISMVIPEVVGFKLTGRLPEGATATDLVLTVTEMLRKKGVVGKFVEFYGDGLDRLPLADRATIGNMAPSTARRAASSRSTASRWNTFASPDARPSESLWSRPTPSAGAVARQRRPRPIFSDISRSISARSSQASPVPSGRRTGSR